MTMKSNWIIFHLCLLLFSGLISVQAQQNFNETLVYDLPDKSAVSFTPETVVMKQSAVYPMVQINNLQHQVLTADNNRIVRFLTDRVNNVFFGYELKIEAIPQTNQFRVSMSPLAQNVVLPGNSLSNKQRKPTILTLPQAVTAQTLTDGDALVMDLLVNPQLELKIVDKIRVSFDREKLIPTRIPRDFTLDEVEIALQNTRLTINDETFPIGKTAKSYSGNLLWLYLPPKGFFMLSLTPREGYDFRKIGVLQDNKIKFEIDGDTYELNSSQPILPNGGTWSLWILHDRNYQPPFLFSTTEYEANNLQKQEPKKSSSIIDIPKKTGNIIITGLKLFIDFARDITNLQRKDRETSAFTPEKNPDFSRNIKLSPPVFLPNVRIGGVKQVENIFLKK
jgi:hypothetical protein